MKKILIEKTSKPIKLAQLLVQLGFVVAIILGLFGYYGSSAPAMMAALILCPLLILLWIAVRFWRWWQHD